MEHLERLRFEIAYIVLFCIAIVCLRGHTDSMRVCVIANLAWVVVSVGYYYFLRKKRPECSLLSIFHGIWSGLGMFFAVWFVYRFVFGYDATVNHPRDALAAGGLLTAVLFQVLVAVTEELAFRGSFYEIMKQLNFPESLCSFWPSILFAGMHFVLHASPLQAITAYVVSRTMFTLRCRVPKYTLTSCIVMHAVYDIAFLFVVF